MLAISILVLLVSGALFFLLYMIGHFYKDLKNPKIERLNRICDYLDAIRLKRIFVYLCFMSYQPPYKITPKIIDLVSKISEAIGSFYAQEEFDYTV